MADNNNQGSHTLFDWAMMWTLVLFVIDSLGKKNFTPFQIVSPMIGLFLAGVVAVLITRIKK